MKSDDLVWGDTLRNFLRLHHKAQVELFFRSQHAFMRRQGLADCSKVVDLGTGDTRFLNRIAALYPGRCYFGVDKQASMIKGAEATKREKNVELIHGNALDEHVQTLLSEADGILMRYFILHLPNTKKALPQILSKVKPGTRLWIFDLDTDLFRCKPPDSDYNLLKNLVQEFCDSNGVAIRTGKQLPRILESAGFEVCKNSVEPCNNRRWSDPHDFILYAIREATLYYCHKTNKCVSEGLDKFSEFLLSRMTPEHLVQIGMRSIYAVRSCMNTSAHNKLARSLEHG